MTHKPIISLLNMYIVVSAEKVFITNYYRYPNEYWNQKLGL